MTVKGGRSKSTAGGAATAAAADVEAGSGSVLVTGTEAVLGIDDEVVIVVGAVVADDAVTPSSLGVRAEVALAPGAHTVAIPLRLVAAAAADSLILVCNAISADASAADEALASAVVNSFTDATTAAAAVVRLEEALAAAAAAASTAS